MLETAMHYSHTLLKECVHNGDLVVDATMGNGYDTLFLSQLVGPTGEVFGFDVQSAAVKNTKERVDNAPNVHCILDGHENMEHYLPKDRMIQAAIFNLGYLPKSDKSIITQPQTTIAALNYLVEHLAPAGRIVIVLYYGHPGGEKEKRAVLRFAKQLKQDTFNVMTYQFINQCNQPPICLCIEKKNHKGE